MSFGNMITWGILKAMIVKGNKVLNRMDANSLDAMGTNEKLLMRILQ